jgi:hypothetical protein
MQRPLVAMAPEKLWQSILPWNFYQQGAQIGLINIDLGASGDTALENRILDKVGSYGRQLGRIGDVMEILLRAVDEAKLSEDDKTAIADLRTQLHGVRREKAKR